MLNLDFTTNPLYIYTCDKPGTLYLLTNLVQEVENQLHKVLKTREQSLKQSNTIDMTLVSFMSYKAITKYITLNYLKSPNTHKPGVPQEPIIVEESIICRKRKGKRI